MKHLKESSLGTIVPFSIPSVTHAEELLFSCLHGVESVSEYIRHDVAIKGDTRRNSFSICIQKLLEKKFDNIIEHFTKANEEILFLLGKILTKKAHYSIEAEFHFAKLKASSKQQALLTDIVLEHRLVATEVSITCGADWLPLVKDTTEHVAAYPSKHTSAYKTYKQKQVGCSDNLDLAGRCVLCVAGRVRLYPEYHRLVETSVGNLLIFRGDQKDDMVRLYSLIVGADTVVCLVDCVNHEIYFAVKRYYKSTGKPCTLLERSNLSTFRKGIETLVSAPVRSTVF